jgi:uncharacterized SAM-binding protein YcdF (DUF218 family)
VRPKSRARRWLYVLALVVIVAIFHAQILAALGGYLVHGDLPQKADAALVLAGDGWGNRILTAAQLARDGYVPKVLVSGPDGAYGQYESGLAIPFAVKHGYPASYFIPVDHKALSTQSEAAAVMPEIRREGIRRLLLVTSNYHTRRAGRIFRALAPDLTILVVAAPDRSYTPDGWWHNREAQKIFLAEWEKTIANWLGI